MKMLKIKIPYGRGTIECTLPCSRVLGKLARGGSARGSIASLVSKAFARPSVGVALKKAIAGKRRILIAVPDATRHAYVKEILPRLFGMIDRSSQRVTIIVATGLHKQHSRRELEELLGKAAFKSCRVVGHGLGKDDIVALGNTRKGVPITLNGNLFDHDVVLSIGVIEPHLYAGYSGGAKTVAIGLAGQETINATHGVRFLDDPLVGLGSVERNPFQNALWEITSKVPLAFSVNVVNDHQGRAAQVFCGGTKTVYRRGVAFARKVYEMSVRKQADIVICGIGHPKDINLYQASRAINYVANVDRPVLRRGGVLIVVAELRDGPGTSPAEFTFYDTLKAMRSPKDFISKVKRGGCVAGEHRAYMVAGPLLDYEVVFVSPDAGSFMEPLPFKTFGSISDALSYADTIVGTDASVYIIPRALSTVARVK